MSEKQRSLGVPEAGISRSYPANETTEKPVTVLRTSLAVPYCELREGRVWIGYRLGHTRHAETSFSVPEFNALVPQLRAVVAAVKESSK